MGWETSHTSSTFDAGEQVSNIQTGRNREKAGYSDFDVAMGGPFSDGVMSGFGQETHYEGNVFEQMGNGFNSMFGIEHRFGTEVTTGYDIVGIDGNKIGPMRDSITDYVNSVQTYLKHAIEATEAEIANAIRGGDAEKAVKEYLEKVKSYVHNLVSTLLAFNDKLADVGNAWVQAQSNIGQNVNASTGSFSEGSTYTDNNVTYSGPSR